MLIYSARTALEVQEWCNTSKSHVRIFRCHTLKTQQTSQIWPGLCEDQRIQVVILRNYQWSFLVPLIGGSVAYNHPMANQKQLLKSAPISSVEKMRNGDGARSCACEKIRSLSMGCLDGFWGGSAVRPGQGVIKHPRSCGWYELGPWIGLALMVHSNMSLANDKPSMSKSH